ncbi:MAG: hypothetical protein OWT28_11465 [Firmicutes bacterium]|nr:hypothetical protein [Bacillota bacterium]
MHVWGNPVRERRTHPFAAHGGYQAEGFAPTSSTPVLPSMAMARALVGL